jgi:hypothetical protein
MVAPLPKPKPQPATHPFTGHSSTGQTPPIPADAPSETPSDPTPETHAPDFNPRDPRQIQSILDLFTNPDLSLRDIADQSNTTLQALTLWLARPDITEQLLDLECVSVRRARFNISFALPKIANALSQSLEQATAEAEHLDRLANNFPCFTLRLRYRENIRKSVSHLLRISGFDPTAKHRSESERRRRAEQTAQWRERCGLSMLDKFDEPSDPSASPIPQSEIPNPKSDSTPSSHPPSDIPHPTSSYMVIAADEQGRTQIRGLTIPPELNKPGMPFTPVFDDSFDPSDPSVPSVLSSASTPPKAAQAPDDDDEDDDDVDQIDELDQDAPVDFSSFFILTSRILAALDLFGPELTDGEVTRAMIMIQNKIEDLGEEIVGLPLEEIVEKVSENLFGAESGQASSSPSLTPSRAPPLNSSA